MRKAIALALIAFSFCVVPPRGVSQDTVPVIYLSAGESIKAKQLAENLKSAYDRNYRARAAWQIFRETFQAAHPGLPNLKFASDLKVAFAVRDSLMPIYREAAVIELSAQEHEKAESLQKEMTDASRALDEAQMNWRNYQNEIVSDHFPSGNGGMTFKRSDGRVATISDPWSSGVAFTPDYRVAVPSHP